MGDHIRQLMTRDKTHIVAMTGSYFRGDAEAVLHPEDEAKFDTVTYTYYEQLNGYQYLKQLDIGYYFYSGSYTDAIMEVLNPHEKTILHIPNVNSRESTKDKIKEVEHIIEELGEWLGTDPSTGFQWIKGDLGGSPVLNLSKCHLISWRFRAPCQSAVRFVKEPSPYYKTTEDNLADFLNVEGFEVLLPVERSHKPDR